MIKKELKYILQEGEGYLIEFKEKVNASIARELVAYANASGGRIFIGIDDRCNIKGIKGINTEKSRIQDIASNCQPIVPIDIELFEDILIVHIPEGIDKPYQSANGFFIRMGANSQKMSRDHLVEFLQGEGKIRFEEQFHRNFDFSKHYEPGKLNGFLKLAGISREVDDELILEHATITCCVFDGIEQVDVINRKDYQDGAVRNYGCVTR